MDQFTYIYGPIYNTSNPASVDIRNGIIHINTCVWWTYTEFERKIILLHEQFHFLSQNTTNEIDCDQYAFDKVAGTEHNSLIQYVDLIKQLSGDDQERFDCALKRALVFAAKKGSKEANELLKNF